MYAILMWYCDRSGMQAVFGPYDNKEHAAAALAELETWPMAAALWEIVPMNRFKTQGR